MGYRKKRGLDLEFPDEFTDSSGEKLAVCIAGGTIEEYFVVKEAVSRPITTVKKLREDMAEIFDVLGPKLVSWNLEEADGSVIPFNRETFAAQDRSLVATIVDAWLTAVRDVPAPLPQPSPVGDPSGVASIPTEPLSGVPTS